MKRPLHAASLFSVIPGLKLKKENKTNKIGWKKNSSWYNIADLMGSAFFVHSYFKLATVKLTFFL
jgi:hypothetical protein